MDKQLRAALLHYVFSGNNLFSPTTIDEDLEFLQVFNQKEFVVKLRKVSFFNLEDLDHNQMDTNPIALTFINLLIQKIMR